MLASWGFKVNHMRSSAMANMRNSGVSGGWPAKIVIRDRVPGLYQILYPFGDPAADYVYTNVFASLRLGFYLHKFLCLSEIGISCTQTFEWGRS